MALRIIKTLEQIKQIKNNPKKMVKKLAKLIDAANVHSFGIEPLKRVFGKDAFFVMGNIFGILPSFSDTQTVSGSSLKRRFMGKSWGEYTIPPIRKYMKDKLLSPITKFVSLGINEDDFLGLAIPNTNPPLF